MVRKTKAEGAIAKYSDIEPAQNDTKTKAIINCLIDCDIYDLTSLLLSTFIHNPN